MIQGFLKQRNPIWGQNSKIQNGWFKNGRVNQNIENFHKSAEFDTTLYQGIFPVYGWKRIDDKNITMKTENPKYERSPFLYNICVPNFANNLVQSFIEIFQFYEFGIWKFRKLQKLEILKTIILKFWEHTNLEILQNPQYRGLYKSTTLISFLNFWSSLWISSDPKKWLVCIKFFQNRRKVLSCKSNS